MVRPAGVQRSWWVMAKQLHPRIRGGELSLGPVEGFHRLLWSFHCPVCGSGSHHETFAQAQERAAEHERKHGGDGDV
jgi:hypothetical protein